MGVQSDAFFSRGEPMRRLRELEQQVEALQTARRLESASIGAGGLRVKGGSVIILDAAGNETMRLSTDGLTLQGLLEVFGGIDAHSTGRFRYIDASGNERFRIGERPGGEINLAYKSGDASEHEVVVGTIFVGPALNVAHGLLVQQVDGVELLRARSGESVVTLFRADHDNGNMAFRAGADTDDVRIGNPDGFLIFVGDSASTRLRYPNENLAFRASPTGISLHRPNGNSVFGADNFGESALDGNFTVGGNFDVNGTKNATIEDPADPDTAWSYGADESPHAGRLIHDAHVQVVDGVATIELPDHLSRIATGPWVRGPWPQGHPGSAFGTLDGWTLTIAGDDGPYVVEVVCYRNDPGTEGWEHRRTGRSGKAKDGRRGLLDDVSGMDKDGQSPEAPCSED